MSDQDYYSEVCTAIGDRDYEGLEFLLNDAKYRNDKEFLKVLRLKLRNEKDPRILSIVANNTLLGDYLTDFVAVKFAQSLS